MFDKLGMFLYYFPFNLQCLLKAWLTEKEEALSKVQTSNFKDQTDLSVNVRKLAVSIAVLIYPVKFGSLSEWQVMSLTSTGAVNELYSHYIGSQVYILSLSDIST